MGCCTANEVGPGAEAADPCKRVNYTLGMLLGVDDFVQESAYNLARRREIARELLGYGTVHGLQVHVETGTDSRNVDFTQIRVGPGMAWMPSGTPVCVSSDQCASLDDWLKSNRARLPAPSTAPSGTLQRSFYVVLAHAECLTDNVPIPGEPCRDDSELMKPSRVADAFRLEIRMQPPAQREEDAVRDFVAWLVNLPLAPSSPPLADQEFEDALRAAAHEWLGGASPPSSPPDYMTGMAPIGTSESLLPLALKLWTTELRPLWMARADCGCSAEPIAREDDAVLLAELHVGLVDAGGWVVGSKPDPLDDSRSLSLVERDETRRPYLLSLRMVQELVTRHPVPDPAVTVEGETEFSQPAHVGASLRYAREDHTHGTPTLPDLGGDLSGPIEDARIERLQGTPLDATSPLADGDVLTHEGGTWSPRALPSLGGDLSGPLQQARIESLQGTPLDATSPLADGDVLTLDAGRWVPRPPPGLAPLPALGGDLSGTLAEARVDGLLGVPLLDTSPLVEGQVLTLHQGHWTPRPVPQPPPGQYVGRASAQAYELLAAADVEVALTVGRPTARNRPGANILGGYGSIALHDGHPDGPLVISDGRARVNFIVSVAPLQGEAGYDVQITPVWRSKTPSPFRVFLFEDVTLAPPPIPTPPPRPELPPAPTLRPQPGVEVPPIGTSRPIDLPDIPRPPGLPGRGRQQLLFTVLLLPDEAREAAGTFGFHVALSRYGREAR